MITSCRDFLISFPTWLIVLYRCSHLFLKLFLSTYVIRRIVRSSKNNEERGTRETKAIKLMTAMYEEDSMTNVVEAMGQNDE